MMSLIIEVLQTFGFFTGMTFIILGVLVTIGLPGAMMWVCIVDDVSERDAMRNFFKGVLGNMLLSMTKFSLISGVGVTILIYLRPLLN